MTGRPLCGDVFSVDDYKVEGLHFVIKTVELLSDMTERMARDLLPESRRGEEKDEFKEAMHRQWDLYKPVAGMSGVTAIKWLKLAPEWGAFHLSEHELYESLLLACSHLRAMLYQALRKTPDVAAYDKAAKDYHVLMLTVFPNVSLRNYEHGGFNHVRDVLKLGSLLDWASWFLEAYNKMWKKYLLYHSNGGGGTALKKAMVGHHCERNHPNYQWYKTAQKAALNDASILKSLFVLTCADVLPYVDKYSPSEVRDEGNINDLLPPAGPAAAPAPAVGPAEHAAAPAPALAGGLAEHLGQVGPGL